MKELKEYKKRKLPDYFHFFSIMFLLSLLLYGLKSQIIFYFQGEYIYLFGMAIFFIFLYLTATILNDTKRIILSDEGIYTFSKTTDYRLKIRKYELSIPWKQVIDVRVDVYKHASSSPRGGGSFAGASLIIDYIDQDGDKDSITFDDSMGDLKDIRDVIESYK